MDGKKPESVEEWESYGRLRYHGDTTWYPTQDSHTPEDEAAIVRGFNQAKTEEEIKRQQKDEFDE